MWNSAHENFVSKSLLTKIFHKKFTFYFLGENKQVGKQCAEQHEIKGTKIKRNSINKSTQYLLKTEKHA